MNQSGAPEPIANRILLALPRASLMRLQPSLEFVETMRGDVVERAGHPVEYAYFVNRGLISLVKTMHDGRVVEVGVTGIEGLTSGPALFGHEEAPLDSVVQIPGSAFRIKRKILKARSAEDIRMRDVLEKYANFALSAFGQTAACNRLHLLEQRCCRWLLIAHDSARSDTFVLTQEFLAMMLGVQRAGVSIAASALQKSGLIRYSRGKVTVTNRRGLEAAACECYSTMQQEFERLFGKRAKA